MVKTSKVTKKWWLIFRRFPPEPVWLWRSYWLSICATILLFCLAASVAYVNHGGWGIDLEIGSKPFRCSDQKQYWYKYSKDLKDNIKTIEEKIIELKKIRSNPKDKNYLKQWSWFETEIKQLEKIEKKYKSYQIYSLNNKSFFGELGLIMLTLISFLFIERLILLHAKSISNYYASNSNTLSELENWIKPYIFFSVLISISMASAEVSTSVIATQKTWFGWHSFCVTPYAFVIKNFALISIGFVIAAPFTILWCLSREREIPNLEPSASDGKFGAGRYVEFLQTWTLWLILAPTALGIIWIRYVIEMEPEFSPARLLHASGEVVLIILIVIRLIRNAIILRFRCNEALQGVKSGDKLPADPTIAFVGTAWWKLPATISTALAFIWLVLEKLGLAEMIVNLIR